MCRALCRRTEFGVKNNEMIGRNIVTLFHEAKNTGPEISEEKTKVVETLAVGGRETSYLTMFSRKNKVSNT